VEIAGSVDQDLVSLLSRGSDQNADAVSGRRQGFQRAAGRRRTDVSGASQPERRYPAGDLSKPVPRDHRAQLQGRSPAALPRLVREVFEEAGDDDLGVRQTGSLDPALSLG